MLVGTTYKGIRYTAAAHGCEVVSFVNHGTDRSAVTVWHRSKHRLRRLAWLRKVVPARALSRLEAKLRKANVTGRLIIAIDRNGVPRMDSFSCRDRDRYEAQTMAFLGSPVLSVWADFLRVTACAPDESNQDYRARLLDRLTGRTRSGGVRYLDEIYPISEEGASYTEARNAPAPRMTISEPHTVTAATIGSFLDALRSGAHEWLSPQLEAPPQPRSGPIADIEALAEEIRAGVDYPAPPLSDIEAMTQAVRSSLPRMVLIGGPGWGQPQPDVTQGSPAYMQSLVAQISDETLRRWLAAWQLPEGSTRADLTDRVLEPGPGSLVAPDEARELSRAILADVGSEKLEGARRADRPDWIRARNPDTAEDLDNHPENIEPLEDSEWFADMLEASEKRNDL